MSFKSSQGFQRVSYRLVIAFAFCAVAPAAHAKTDGAGLSSPIAGVSESQKVTIRLSEHQVRLLINSSGEQRELRLRQIAGQKAISLNRELERSIFNEAVLSAMLRSLLDESVEQAAFAQALANQAKFYGKLSDQLTELMEAAEEWRGPLQEAINTIEAGRFEDADLELAEIARALEETQVVVSSRQRSRQLGAAGIAATRAHLAVVRSHLAEASRLYEDAFSLYSDEAALVPAEWLVLGAQTAASHGDQARALEYLELANALAVRQIQSGTPFPEWLNLRWLSAVLAAELYKSAENLPKSLERFRASVEYGPALTAAYLKSPEVSFVLWNARNNIQRILMAQGDLDAATQENEQALQLAQNLTETHSQDPKAWFALSWSQLMAAEQARLDGKHLRLATMLVAARGSAREFVNSDNGSSRSLKILLVVLRSLMRLPDRALLVSDFHSFAIERVATVNKLALLYPGSIDTYMARWESFYGLADLQRQMGQPEKALEDAQTALKSGQEFAVAFPGNRLAMHALYESHKQIAKLRAGSKDFVGAIDSAEMALEIARSLADKFPGFDEVQLALWNGLTDLGDFKHKAGNPNGALTYQLMASQVASQTPNQDGDEVAWLGRARFSFSRLGDLYEGMGLVEEETENFSRAVEFSHKAQQRARTLKVWSYGHWYALSKWGVALAKRRQFDEALKAQIEAEEYVEAIFNMGNSMDETSVGLWFSRREVGATLIDMGDLQKGLEKYLSALQLADRQMQAHPKSATWKSYRETTLEELDVLKKRDHQ